MAPPRSISPARATQIDVLLTDVVMPWMNGGELAEQLRALRPELAVLFMTGYSDNVVLSRGVVKPDVELLTKPFTSNELDAMLRKVAGQQVAAS